MIFDPSSLGNFVLVITAWAGAFFAALWLSLVIWTYRDIRGRARDPLARILAVLVVAVLFLPGVVIYLILRPSRTMRTTDSRHADPIAPNHLATHPPPTGPNPIWVADLTYVPTAAGWLYVAVIMDVYSRRIIGWAAGLSLATTTVLAALRMALTHRHPPVGLLYHTDRGVQYASVEHRAVLAAAGIEPSMSRAGNPYDNAAMESFMATYKRECVALVGGAGGYATPAEATTDFFDYVECYYNRQRRHSALGYQTPLDFETNVN